MRNATDIRLVLNVNATLVINVSCHHPRRPVVSNP